MYALHFLLCLQRLFFRWLVNVCPSQSGKSCAQNSDRQVRSHQEKGIQGGFKRTDRGSVAGHILMQNGGSFLSPGLLFRQKPDVQWAKGLLTFSRTLTLSVDIVDADNPWKEAGDVSQGCHLIPLSYLLLFVLPSPLALYVLSFFC